MWSPLALLFLVGYALASTPAFKDNTEYVYDVNGRTLSSLHEVSDQYSGIFLKAKLHLSKRSDDKVQGRISDPQYAPIHSHLCDGWDTEVPESQLSYKQLALSGKPFEIGMDSAGLIKNIVVEKEVSNMEANIIKSICSQYQLDVRGKNAIDSPINDLPSEDKLDGVFKTMEETVTGETETTYKMHPLPLYILQSQPWLVRKDDLQQDNDRVVEVIKSKNYTNSEEKPSYHYGFGDIHEHEPTANSLGQFLTRQSHSRAILTGKPSRFTIQNSYTVNKIMIRPTFNNKERGSVISMVNVTLREVKNQDQKPQDLSNPNDIGNLIYTYDNPFSQNKDAKQKRMEKYHSSEERSDSEEETSWGRRSRRHISQHIHRHQEGNHDPKDSQQQQQKPRLEQAPSSPLLPYYMGYHGKSVKQSSDFDVKQNVQNMAQDIAENLMDPDKILKQDTLSKYVMLSSLMRLMDKDEIKQVSEQLYSPSGKGKDRLTWEVYRDALAVSGTGPAFLHIKELIESKKITKGEAADVVATMAKSVRTPTEDYMKQFFELTKNSRIMEEEKLNQTAVLAYCNLLYRVYMNRNESHSQYPVHSFGSFNSREGRKYVRETVIPYYKQQLDRAISEGQSNKIHLFITALGDIGDRDILSAFKPYLEGTKQCSQFQRMLMVSCLRRLARSQRNAALPVLYKIYQNAGELPDVRISAAYVLFRDPQVLSERLQSMAENTHIEYQEQLNAAVKSAIESASRLESRSRHNLRDAAQTAVPLLNDKLYGADKSHINFRDYVIPEMDSEFHHDFVEIGSPDSYWPKAMKAYARGHVNEIPQQYYDFKAMTSSIKELFDVLYEKTSGSKQAKKLRSQERDGDSKWSSANIAQQMNYFKEEREQLENYIYAEIAGLQSMWSYDNRSIDNLPQAIREYEDTYSKGKEFSYTKLRQIKDLALSVPTEMGLPFLYTSDKPVLVRWAGKIEARATPQISDGQKLSRPDKIKVKISSAFTFSVKDQSHLSFVTPCDHQIYIAGFDRNVQAHLPLSADVDIDVKEGEATVECEVQNPDKDARLLHYSTWPYTSKGDLMSTSPVSLRPNTQIIPPKESQSRYFDTQFGKSQTGMTFRAWGHHPVQSVNLGDLLHMYKAGDMKTLLKWVWDRSSLTQTEMSVAYVPNQSSTKKVTLRFSHKKQYKEQPEKKEQEDFLSYSQLNQKCQGEPKKRQENLLKYVEAGINNGQSHAYEVWMEFDGDKKRQHGCGVTFCKSNVDSKSRTMIYYTGNGDSEKQCSLDVKANIPNTNGLDLTDSLKNAPEAKYEMRMQCGPNENDAAQVSGKVNFKRSQQRKDRVTQKPLYNVCKRQMKEGNFQLPACQNMTIEANYMDVIQCKWQYNNIDRKYSDIVKSVYEGFKVYYYPETKIESIDDQKNNIQVEVRYEPEELRRVNVSIASGDERTTIYNVSLGSDYAKALLVPHPVFHVKSRLVGVLQGWQLHRPTCVIDQSAIQTFSNNTYPLSLGNDWTVAVQYIPQEARRRDQPKQPSVFEQLKDQQENYAILVRQASEDTKEVMITFNHEESEGKTVEINLKCEQSRQRKRSGSDPAATVYIDGKQIQFTDKQSYDLYNGFVQIYALRNGEVKVEIQGAFYTIYDGKRIKVTSTGGKLRDSNRGLCGKFSNDKYEDFTVPADCVVSDPRKFTDSYQVEKSKRPQRDSQECVAKVMPLYARVGFRKSGEARMNLRTRYAEQNGEICFSLQPLPTCKGSPRRTESEPVEAHCIQKTKSALYFKAQIDQGANPDFSQKSLTRHVDMKVHKQCN
ncbi:hypothetical protein GWI33_018354 [Rhynchophorus ferrugineus]|uniref:Vitellogenin n=4 Tax=Endopterygota TaxID=33392 RepID=A0A0S2C3U3_RHYFE|nr:vitellogenin [Rhynchophorus ferrugineus]KAF7268464.1 hypothetical protein GWI33_018354 [Rhynchophorus ferrugineus]